MESIPHLFFGVNFNLCAYKNNFDLKKVQLSLIFVIIALTSVSQQDFIPETFLGVKGGATYSYVDFSPSVNEQRILGYQAGLMFRNIQQRYVGLQVELNYTVEGWGEETSLIEDGSSYYRTLTYIELPLLTT